MATPGTRLAWGLAAALVAGLILASARALRRRRREARDRRALEASRQPETVEILRGLLPGADVPELGGWAVAPDLALLLVREVLARRPRLVLELGSGRSSVVLAEALRRAGGRLVSLEHDADHAAASTALLRVRELDALATVVHAPLVPGEHGPFYDLQALARLEPGLQGPFDLVFVDGPPATTDPEARRPALPALSGRLSPDALVVLDDANRPGERSIVEGWRRVGLLAAFEEERVPLLRGALVLKRRPAR